jgi:hypothetical protein
MGNDELVVVDEEDLQVTVANSETLFPLMITQLSPPPQSGQDVFVTDDLDPRP